METKVTLTEGMKRGAPVAERNEVAEKIADIPEKLAD
jgi:hypothetical protein